jgi:hypothetical protein
MNVRIPILRGLAVCVVASALIRCGERYEQEFRGSITEDGKPVAFLPVRFLSSGERESCDLPGLETRTDRTGRFSVRQQYQPSVLENVAVAIHPYRLCVYRNDHWQRIWGLKSGPAPKTIELECKLGENPECRVSWGGHAFREREKPR